MDVEQARLGSQVMQKGPHPEGMLALLELWRNWDVSTPTVTLAWLEKISKNKQLPATRRSYATWLLARGKIRLADVASARTLVSALGYVTSLRVVGPFDNEGKNGFNNVLPPEESTSPEQPKWQGKEREVSWRVHPDVSIDGFVNLSAMYRPSESVCAIAEATVTSTRAQPLTVWVGSGGAVRVWWNSEMALEDSKYRRPHPERFVAVVGANAGINRLRIKSCTVDGMWGFYLRLGNSEGGPPKDISVRATVDGDTQSASGTAVVLPKAPETVLSVLEKNLETSPSSAEANENLARFLEYTGADDPRDRRARELAERAVELEATVKRLRLAASLVNERGERMRFAKTAFTLAPHDPIAQLLQAEVLRDGPTPESALPILETLQTHNLHGMEAQTIRAEIFQHLGLHETAAEILGRLAAQAPQAPRWSKLWANALETADHTQKAFEVRNKVLEGRYDEIGTRQSLLDDAVQRGDVDTATRHAEVFRTLEADNVNLQLHVAQAYYSLGQSDEALQVFRNLRDLAPEDADVLAAQGRVLLQLAQTEAAAAALRGAIALRPQDAETRELLQQIRPTVRADEEYAISTQQILSRKVESSDYAATVLQNLTVNTVFHNGLGSSFHQFAVEVHSPDGARQWRTQPISFDPNSQRVEIRAARVYRGRQVLEATETFEETVGEPWYRMYYDQKILFVVFPDLEPGDVVELRYRRDDIAHRNIFADYYGDLEFLQDTWPIQREDYVLIAPKSREMYFNQPHLRGLHHETKNESVYRTDHFWVTNVQPLHPEDHMAGMTEVAPYLHISTYRTWQDVGKWYWGLIQDQLVAPESLRRTVQTLVKGETDVRAKVNRIYDWVIQNTRYVALEFGIHGYKPYRISQIIQRGFGDCKDKASLLYVMLREAGINARVVLVRTRDKGTIGELPASLAVFNHAIAYVPEVDMYLDGTAEHSKAFELPSLDQGITVLVVGPEGAELRRTPVLPPDMNRKQISFRVELSEDGSAQIDGETVLRGQEASEARRRFQAVGTQNERLESALRATFPGLQLMSHRFDSLDSPVQYHYRARVPQFAQRDDGSLAVPLSALDDIATDFARTPRRQFALDLKGTLGYVEQRRISVPAGYRVSETPRNHEVKGDFGKFQIEVVSDNQEVRVTTTFEVSRDKIPADQYPAFRSWLQSIDRFLKERISFRPVAK